ncbi:hypothetical protein OAG10_06070 [Verrucomicrobia bacterium]|nr:hypothetical protein [Verrucomicrobiota bacterium]
MNGLYLRRWFQVLTHLDATSSGKYKSTLEMLIFTLLDNQNAIYLQFGVSATIKAADAGGTFSYDSDGVILRFESGI